MPRRPRGALARFLERDPAFYALGDGIIRRTTSLLTWSLSARLNGSSHWRVGCGGDPPPGR